MKLEFLEDISDNGKFSSVVTDQLVRLFDFDKDQAKSFKEIIQRTIIERGESLDLAKVEFIDPINCNLILRLAEVSIGIIKGDKTNFFCDLTIDQYEEMANLLDAFCVKENNGYQWLYDINTPIDFLFSTEGNW
jgi:hypothetical protein